MKRFLLAISIAIFACSSAFAVPPECANKKELCDPPPKQDPKPKTEPAPKKEPKK